MNEFLFTPAGIIDPASAPRLAEHILVQFAKAGHAVEAEPADGGFRVRTDASEAEAHKLAPHFGCRAATVSLAPVAEPVAAAPEPAVEVPAVQTPAEPAVVESVTPTEPPAAPEFRPARRGDFRSPR